MLTSGKTLTLSELRISLPAYRSLRGAAFILLLMFFLNSLGRAQDLNSDRIFSWKFAHADDLDSDGWPDAWKRRKDLKHPSYIQMRIEPRDIEAERKITDARKTMVRLMKIWETGRIDPYFVAESTPPALAEFLDATLSNSCFAIEMDGSSAEVVGPVFPLDSRFSFELQVDQRVDGLGGHEAWVELQLLNDEGQLVDSIVSERISGTTDWKTVVTGDDNSTNPNVAQGRIHLHVQPNGTLNFFGKAMFDNIAIYRLPRLSLSTPAPMNIVEPGANVQIDCTAMGVRDGIEDVEFELRDIDGMIVATHSAKLERMSEDQNSKSIYFVGKDPSLIPHYVAPANLTEVLNGRATWKLDINEPGIYFVSANVGNRSRSQDRRRALLLGVMEPSKNVEAGPFGWSIKEFDYQFQPADLPRLASRFGAGWLKYPIWFEMSDLDYAEELAQMTQKLQSLGIRCIGRIDTPPTSQQSEFESINGKYYAAAIFRESEIWEPYLEPVLTKLGMRLNWYQLGRDDDLSLMRTDGVQAFVKAVRDTMQTYCQELRLIMGWDWLEMDPPKDASALWNAIQYRAESPLAATELKRYLDDTADSNFETWISFNPIPASEYKLATRVRDLTERVVEVKRSRVSAALLSDPFDLEQGLLTEDGNINEMLIPWHQLVSNFGKAKYVGSIDMPAGSVNHVFVRGNEGIMLLWNDQVVDEHQFLGSNLSAHDIWGRPVEIEPYKLETGAVEQRFAVGKWPIILKGVDIDVVQWRLQFKVNVSHLESNSGASQVLPILVANPFQQSINCKVTLSCPSLLQSGWARSQFQIGANRTDDLEFPIQVRSDASAGEHQLRFDFAFDAGEAYQFSVYRNVVLGINDIEIEWDVARINPQQIQLRMEMKNNSPGNVSFDCKLFPPGLPYRRFQIRSAPKGDVFREFTLAIPESGEAKEHWLRCDGIGSGRVLNYRLKF